MESASQSARARVRRELTAEIKAAASVALARDGAVGLSLRGVARDVGMSPSALYRYFASRDELLTELIIDAYHSLADQMEGAATADAPFDRWVAVARALRCWAFARPHEWALLYGSPVPGYHAPERTVPAALRVPRALADVVEAAQAADQVGWGGDARPPADALASVAPIGPGLPTTLPPDLMVAVIVAWEQLAGAVSLDLFGHFAGGLTDPQAVFDYVASATAQRVGLGPRVPLNQP
jgi:AcrR family transcriptional regulator